MQQYGAPAREHFALREDVEFLNHGSFGATPRLVLAKRHALMMEMESHPGHFMLQTVQPALARAAETARTWLGGDSGDLVFVDNATTAANAVLRGLKLEAGDRVVTLDHVYGAVRNAAQYVCDRAGAELVVAALPFPLESEDQALDTLVAVLKGGARLAILDHITSPTGLVLPIERMVAACRSAGVPVFVDAAHSPGQVPMDLDSLGADWVTGNLHKWAFAAKGTAVLWIAPHAHVDALVVSHHFNGTPTASFHWPGTRDFCGWMASTAAIEFHSAMGGTALMERNRRVCAEAAERVAHAWGVQIPSPASCRAALCTLPLPTLLPSNQDTCIQLHRRLLAEHRIEVPFIPFADRCWLRFSVQIYNEPEQYDHLGNAVIELLRS